MRWGVLAAAVAAALVLMVGAGSASAQAPCDTTGESGTSCTIAAGGVECAAVVDGAAEPFVAVDRAGCTSGESAAECGQLYYYDWPYGPTTGCTGSAAGVAIDCRRYEGMYRSGGDYDVTRCGASGPASAGCVRDDETQWDGSRTVSDACAVEAQGARCEAALDQEPGAVALPRTPAFPVAATSPATCR